jgi:ceramide glucosyltransferase
VTFAACFAPEILTTSIVPMAAGGIAAAGAGFDVPAALVVLATVWSGSEAVLARSSGWHMTFASPLAWIVRDFLIPVFWVAAWTGNSFNWRGNEMSATRASSIAVDADTAAAKSI